MTTPVEFWFEFASTYSYPAAMQVEDACRAAEVPLIWRPFLLGPVFAAQGLTNSPFALYPVKGAYMWRDVERICAEAGLDFVRSKSFPRGSILAARIAADQAEAIWVGAFIREVYRANFAEDRDIGAREVIADLLTGLGQDAEAVIASAETSQGKDRLKALTAQAQEAGIFGAPSYLVGDELFWGQDRQSQALDWARR